MKRRTILRVSIGVAVGFAALFAAAWLAFVPSPREPGYIFVASWGHKGAGPGEFHDPTGIAVSGREVFVADARNGRIQVFDLDGGFKRQIGSPGEAPGQLGRADQARATVKRILELDPDFEATARAKRWKWFRYQEDLLDTFMDGLRKAGLNIPDKAAAAE